MTHHDNLDRDLPLWLTDDAGRQVPAGLLDAIASESRTRRQQPAWLVALRGESMGAASFGMSRGLRIALVVVLVAVAALGALLVAGMLPKPPQDNSPLAFIRDGDVYLAAGDGSQARLVLHQDGVEFSKVAWSPDRHTLALDGESVGVVVFDTLTGRAIVVGNHNPAWSPDGRELAVLAGEPGQSNGELRILDAETLVLHTVYPFDAFGGLAWSPNGRWIAATGGERSASVVRLDVSTGEVIQIAAVSGHLDSLKHVSWSPDSRRVAFIRYNEGPGVPDCFDSRQCRVDVFVADADGSNAVRVNQMPAQADTPRWSPDGTWIAFREMDVDVVRGFGIHVVRSDGTSERTIISAPVAAYVWSPASDRLVFARWDGSNPAVLWETSLTGQARSLDLVIDTDRSFLAGTGVSFDWQATGT